MAYRTSSPKKQAPSEIIARAMEDAANETANHEQWCSSDMADAGGRAAIEALLAAGYVIVPREPTMAMQIAAINSGWGSNETLVPEIVWRAMVEAAGG